MACNEEPGSESPASQEAAEPALVTELRLIRAALEKQDIRCCGCAHESIIAERYTSESRYREVFNGPQRRAAALAVLCPQEIRQNSPLCAHATESFDADPFGPQLERLIALGMVAQETITAIAKIASRITHIDTVAATLRWEGRTYQRKILAKKVPYLPVNDAARAQWVEQRMKELVPEAVAIDAAVQEQTRAQQKPLAEELAAHRATLIALIDARIGDLTGKPA